MPDWSYRTVFQPLLFRLPFETARRIALGSMGRLAQLPGGTRIIELMGHMAPDERLQTNIAGRQIASPLMLGCSVDPHLRALPALARFGFGLLEVGPVGQAGTQRGDADRLSLTEQSLITAADSGAISAGQVHARLQTAGLPRDSVVVRFAEPPGNDAGESVEFFRRIVDELHALVGCFSLPLTMIADPEAVERVVPPLVDMLHRHDAHLFAVVDVDRGEGTAAALATAACASGANGLIVDVTQQTASGDVARGPCCFEAARRLTRSLRSTLGKELPMIVSGGIHEPLQAVQLIADGATLVQIDSGLIFTGPGLPKRAGDALLCQRVHSQWLVGRVISSVANGPAVGVRVKECESEGVTANAEPLTSDIQHLPSDIRHPASSDTLQHPLPPSPHDSITSGLPVGQTRPPDGHSPRPGRQAWLWTLLMGVAMLIGGLMAMVIAVTRVVMPYDEQFVGMTRSELAQVNDKLLLFMTHDRVTLAGTMLALGTLYSLLSWYGIRRGWHWAQVAIIASAFVGFFTFFLFLGFGYFDPLHAFVTAVLFQFLLLGVHAETTRSAYNDVPNLTNHAAWRRSQWGQLIYVVHGAMLIAAGAVICSYGVTSVFVPEDLEFMQTTREALCAANPQLLPLVAHDRATFGGMLVACGITVLLASMWGFRQGNSWLWWALFAGGNVAYVATILVHWSVGYTSLNHLLPAYGGLIAVWIGSTLSRRFLCETDKSDGIRWREVIDSVPGQDSQTP